MFAAENETDHDDHSDDELVLLGDAIGHEELCTIYDQSGEVTEEEYKDNANKDTGKIHLIVS